jgi:hypothetical protein
VAEPVLAKALLLGCRVLQASDFEAGTSTMDRPPINPKPVVEPGADELEHGELTTHALRARIRQQEILAELGVLALQARPFLELLNETSRLTAEGMGPARWQSCSHIAVIADHTGSKVPLEEPSFRRGFFSYLRRGLGGPFTLGAGVLSFDDGVPAR